MENKNTGRDRYLDPGQCLKALLLCVVSEGWLKWVSGVWFQKCRAEIPENIPLPAGRPHFALPGLYSIGAGLCGFGIVQT